MVELDESEAKAGVKAVFHLDESLKDVLPAHIERLKTPETHWKNM